MSVVARSTKVVKEDDVAVPNHENFKKGENCKAEGLQYLGLFDQRYGQAWVIALCSNTILEIDEAILTFLFYFFQWSKFKNN